MSDYINEIKTECKDIESAGICETNDNPCLFLTIKLPQGGLYSTEVFLTEKELKNALKEIKGP
jgi:hypothetical protein